MTSAIGMPSALVTWLTRPAWWEDQPVKLGFAVTTDPTIENDPAQVAPLVCPSQ